MAFVAYGAYVRLQRSISDNEITSILRLPMKYAFLLGLIGYVLTVCAQSIDFVRALQGKKMGSKEAEHG